jgi:hypothetical protein
MWVIIGQPGESLTRFARYVEVDIRGQFFADNIPPGTYELTARAVRSRMEIRDIPAVTQSITIEDGVEKDITVVIKLTRGKE